MVTFALVPLILLLVTLGGLVWLWGRVVRGRKLGDLPVCGACGYGTRGLTGLTCPECGADLREVGIVTPRARGQVGPAKFIGLWTLLLPVPMLVAAGMVEAFVAPRVVTARSEQTLGPNSGNFDTFRIELRATWASRGHGPGLSSRGSGVHHRGGQMTVDPGFRGKADVVTLQIERQGQQSESLRITRADHTVRFRAADGSRIAGDADDPAVIRQWLLTSGVPADAAGIDTDAEAVADIVAQLQRDPPRIASAHFRHRSSGGSTSAGTDPRWTWSMLALALAIYGGGIGLFFRLRPRRG